MTGSSGWRLAVVPVGLTLSAFFAVTFLLCVLAGLALGAQGMRMALEAVLPGFVWISGTSILIGLAWALIYAWYVALVAVPIYNVAQRLSVRA